MSAGFLSVFEVCFMICRLSGSIFNTYWLWKIDSAAQWSFEWLKVTGSVCPKAKSRLCQYFPQLSSDFRKLNESILTCQHWYGIHFCQLCVLFVVYEWTLLGSAEVHLERQISVQGTVKSNKWKLIKIAWLQCCTKRKSMQFITIWWILCKQYHDMVRILQMERREVSLWKMRSISY